MKDAREVNRGNRNTSLSGDSGMDSTEASAWTFMKPEWRHVPRITGDQPQPYPAEARLPSIAQMVLRIGSRQSSGEKPRDADTPMME